MVAAVRVHAYGGPEVLTLEDIDLPPPGPGELRVRQSAIGVNYIDTYFRSGKYQAPSLPFVLGNEGAGEVVAVGEGASGFSPGDKVGYAATLGCYAAERNVPASAAVKLPTGIGEDVAAATMLKGLTAEYLLHRTYKVKAGDIILVHAAAGGVGLILSQWAKHLGATVIGTVGSAEKGELARANGCDHVILYREQDFAAEVKRITAGALCNVVYDGIGKDTYPASLDCLRPLGVMASFGAASGAIENFNLALLGPKGSLFVTRPTLFTFTANRAWLNEMAANLFGVIGSGAVKISINHRARLADAAEVHRALEGRGTTGSTVMAP
jgi:NADPH2:quinone reductase